MSGRGPALRAAREARGLSLEALSRRTRIPVQHLRALEEGRDDDIPAGPYAGAYLRALQRELGLDLDLVDEPTPPAAPGGLPLWAVRLLAASSTLALLGLIGWQVWERYEAERAAAAAAMAARPDQRLTVEARRNTRLKVTVDDELVLDRRVAGGEELVFEGHDRIEVEVPAVSAARWEYNGRSIVPQGRQDAPRRLVFVDDLQGTR